MSSLSAASLGALSIGLITSAASSNMYPSGSTASEPSTPTKPSSAIITAATPPSASPSPILGRGLTRSGRSLDLAAALAEDPPAASSSSNRARSSFSVAATNASAASFLAPPPRSSHAPRQEDDSGVTKTSVIAHFVACGNPFGVKVRDENAKEQLAVTPAEIRTLALLYGETRYWTMSIEEVYCERCVERVQRENERDYRSHVTEFLNHNPEVLRAFLRLRGRLSPGPCTHNSGIAQLLRNVGPQDCTRVRLITLTSSDGSFQHPDRVSSAISILLQSFPNIQKATIKLPSGGSLVADGVAVKLARAFELLERALPDEEGLVVEGLGRQPVLAGKWGEVKRGWWERRSQWGRKVLS